MHVTTVHGFLVAGKLVITVDMQL